MFKYGLHKNRSNPANFQTTKETMTMKNNPLSETNWTCIEVNRSANDPRETAYSTCEKCKKEHIPFVYTMYHPKRFRDVFVCRACAEEMSNDSTVPLEKENELQYMEQYFCNHGWTEHSYNRTYSKKHYGNCITLHKGPSGYWGVFFGHHYHWDYNNKKITSLEDAKIAALYLFEKHIAR